MCISPPVLLAVSKKGEEKIKWPLKVEWWSCIDTSDNPGGGEITVETG